MCERLHQVIEIMTLVESEVWLDSVALVSILSVLEIAQCWWILQFKRPSVLTVFSVTIHVYFGDIVVG